MKFTVHGHPSFPRNAIMVGYFPTAISRLPVIAHHMIEVQPMPLPTCHLFDLDERFIAIIAQELADGVDREVIQKLIGDVLDEPKDYFLPKRTDRGRFPHGCPRCGGPAYVGLNDVDCSMGCR